MFDSSCGTRLGNLGDKFFMNQEIPACVLKIFWREIFTSFLILRGNRWLFNVSVTFQFQAQAPGTGLRAGWLLWNCPALTGLKSPFPTRLLVCNLQHGICLEYFPSASEGKLKAFISLYFHRLLYIQVLGICMCIMLQTKQYKQVHTGIHGAAETRNTSKGLTLLPREQKTL